MRATLDEEAARSLRDNVRAVLAVLAPARVTNFDSADEQVTHTNESTMRCSPTHTNRRSGVHSFL